MTLLRYNVDKPRSSYARVHLLARKKEDEKFQKKVYVIYKLKKLILLLNVMNSIYDKIFEITLICNLLQKLIATSYFLSIFFHSSRNQLEHWRQQKPRSQAEIKSGTLSRCTYNCKNSPEEITPTVFEMQHLSDMEKTDTQGEISCLKRTIKYCRGKVCVNFKTEADKLNFVVPLPKQIEPQIWRKWPEVDRRPVEFDNTSLSVELHWQFFQAMQCAGWNNCS